LLVILLFSYAAVSCYLLYCVFLGTLCEYLHHQTLYTTVPSVLSRC